MIAVFGGAHLFYSRKKAEEYLARAERFKRQTNDRDSEDGVLCVVC